MAWRRMLKDVLETGTALRRGFESANRFEDSGTLSNLIQEDLASLWDRLVDIRDAANSAGEGARVTAIARYRGHMRKGEYPSPSYAVLSRLLFIEAALAAELNSKEPEWAERVELALLHLNRSLAVDEGLQSRWQRTWDNESLDDTTVAPVTPSTTRINRTEPRLEALGGVHLLAHGLFGFKARSDGQETDLVLGAPVDRREATRAGSPLVLTEWKKVDFADADDVERKVSAAATQLAQYRAGAAAVLDLKTVRFIVLVSKRAVVPPVPDRTASDGAALRVINIVVAPETASELAARAGANAARAARAPAGGP